MKLKGSLSLVYTKDYIFGFKYVYKNKSEETLAEKIWDKVNDVAIEFGSSLLNYDEVEHYSKKAA
jgi:predicted transcriptional regulator